MVKTFGSLFVRHIVRPEHEMIEMHQRFVYAEILSEDDWNVLDESVGINGIGDYEDSAHKGLLYNWDEFHSIDVDLVLDSLESYKEDRKSWDVEWEQSTYEADKIKEIIKKISPYKGFTLYYDYVPEELKKMDGLENEKND